MAKPETMRLRFRRPVMIAGTVHAANSYAAVPNCDEAWDAVNVGLADLDPAPGVDGQPGPERIPAFVSGGPREQPPAPPTTPKPVAVTPTKK